MIPEDLRPRLGPRLPVVYGDMAKGTYKPPCPWCGEDIAGYHYGDSVIACPDCGKESFLCWEGTPEIIGLRSSADVKYEEWRKGQRESTIPPQP